jgi:hypothetical protein
MDLFEGIAWFGNMLNFGGILIKRDRCSNSGPVRSFPIRWWMAVANGGWSVPGLNPLVRVAGVWWRVVGGGAWPENSGQWPVVSGQWMQMRSSSRISKRARTKPISLRRQEGQRAVAGE